MNDAQVAEPGPRPERPAAPVPSYAWVILAVAYVASVAAPLNQFKVPPVLPVLMESFHLNLGGAGWLMSVFAITGFLLALPAGLILQRLGLKGTALIAMGCLVAGSVLGAVSSTAGWMLAGRVVEGTGMGLIAVVAPAAIALWFPRERQALPMGIWATWVPLGSVLMLVLAPALSAASGWQSVWWFGAGFALLAFVLVLFWMRPPSRPASGATAGDPAPAEAVDLRKALSNRSIWLLGGMFGCFNWVLISMSTYLPTFLSEARGYTMAGASFTASLTMITVLVSAPLAGVLSDRIGSRKALFTWPFLAVAVMMAFPFTVTGTLIPTWMLLMGIVAGLIPTATFAAAPEIMGRPELAGMGMAVVAFGQNLGMFIGPAVFGALAQSSGYPVAGYAMIPVLLLGLLCGWLVKVR